MLQSSSFGQSINPAQCNFMSLTKDFSVDIALSKYLEDVLYDLSEGNVFQNYYIFCFCSENPFSLHQVTILFET